MPEDGDKVLPPDINRSSTTSRSKREHQVRIIRNQNVGGAAKNLLFRRERRPFIDQGFSCTGGLRKVNKKTVEALSSKRFQRHCQPATSFLLSTDRERNQRFQNGEFQGQFSLFIQSLQQPRLLMTSNRLRIFPRTRSSPGKGSDRVPHQRNPLVKFREIIEKKPRAASGIGKEDINKTHILVGVISSKKIIKTKKDNHEMRCYLYDETGSCEAIVFPKLYAKIKDRFPSPGHYPEGQVSEKDDHKRNYG
jgi:DNA polymerase III alpha subunit